jgi:hypothetical protein
MKNVLVELISMLSTDKVRSNKLKYMSTDMPQNEKQREKKTLKNISPDASGSLL